MIVQNIQTLRENTNYGQVHLHPEMANRLNEQINQIIPTINMRYTPYLSDNVNDAGWGCAWRSIQMMLSSLYDITPEFRWLFSFFGSKRILELIYLSKHKIDQIPSYLKESNYAPHELHNYWAEPYIGHLILYYMGFESKLFLVNGYPPNSNAPKKVFEFVLDFQQFRKFLIDQFSSKKTPIQIDDSQYSMVIYNCQIDGDRTILLIGDPHIYYIKDNISQIGLYTITLDENGGQISHSITPEQEQYYMYKNSYGTLHFNEKKWMATCVVGEIDVWQDWKDRQLII